MKEQNKNNEYKIARLKPKQITLFEKYTNNFHSEPHYPFRPNFHYIIQTSKIWIKYSNQPRQQWPIEKWRDMGGHLLKPISTL